MATIKLADIRQIADEFSASVACVAGKHYIKGGLLYLCKTPHTGAWDASHFEQVKVSDEITSLKEDFNSLGLSVVEGKLCVTYASQEDINE